MDLPHDQAQHEGRKAQENDHATVQVAHIPEAPKSSAMVGDVDDLEEAIDHVNGVSATQDVVADPDLGDLVQANQDQVRDRAGIERWASILTDVMGEILAIEDIHEVREY